VWLASFPRSGNTFLRIVLNRLYNVRTTTVYEIDGVALRLGADLVGYEVRTACLQTMRAADRIHLIKTHRPRDEDVEDADPALCLVRDGRDALVSWARQRSEPTGRDYESELRTLIVRSHERGAGQWGRNVLSWLQPARTRRVALRFEDLVQNPSDQVSSAMSVLTPTLTPATRPSIPTFDDLHAIDGRFFRRGIAGTHRDELPHDLEQAFWAQEDNAAAMDFLGYR
jgi:hypothetical protein